MIGRLWSAFRKLRLRQLDNDQWIDYLRSLGVQIGERTRILDRHVPSEPYLIRIGNHVTITSGCRLVTHDGAIWVYRDRDPAINRFAPIEIRDNSFIGLDSIILPGVTIGPDSVVAAGSVVTKDVPPGEIWGGNPARLICTTEAYLEKVLQQQLPVTDDQRSRIAAGEPQSEVMRETVIRHFFGEE